VFLGGGLWGCGFVGLVEFVGLGLGFVGFVGFWGVVRCGFGGFGVRGTEKFSLPFLG